MAGASPTGTSSPFTPCSISAAGPPVGQSVAMHGSPSAMASMSAFGMPS